MNRSWMEIFKFLNVSDIPSVARVCKTWNRMVTKDEVIRKILSNDGILIDDEQTDIVDWVRRQSKKKYKMDVDKNNGVKRVKTVKTPIGYLRLIPTDGYIVDNIDPVIYFKQMNPQDRLLYEEHRRNPCEHNVCVERSINVFVVLVLFISLSIGFGLSAVMIYFAIRK